MANSVVRPHVPEEELHAYCDGELSQPQRIEIAEHLLGCLICRAQHAEVEVVRTKTSALLAVAAPRVIRGPNVRRIAQPAARRRLPRLSVAAAAAIVGLGVWYSVQPSHSAAPVVRAATQVAAVTASDVGPLSGPGWKDVSWSGAIQAGQGSVASVPGMTVTRVRMRASDNGGRPTFMVRQQLANGHIVWVIDSPVGEFGSAAQLVAQAGLTISSAMQTKPRYVGTPAEIARSQRSYAVIGNAADQLNSLVETVNP